MDMMDDTELEDLQNQMEKAIPQKQDKSGAISLIASKLSYANIEK